MNLDKSFFIKLAVGNVVALLATGIVGALVLNGAVFGFYYLKNR